MKKIILASAVASAFAAQGAYAADAAPAATPEHAVAINVGVVTDYRYRGISQTVKKPALNATLDYTHNPTGLYAGVFASTIKWIDDAQNTTGVSGSAPVEIDLYAGKRGEIGGGFTYDAGGLFYYYPNNKYASVGPAATPPFNTSNANTAEVYGQLGYGPAYLKYFYAVTDLFGNANTVGSYYLDASVNQEITEGYVLNLHYGYQHMANTPLGTYRDWKIGVTKDYGLAIAAIAYIDTNANGPGFYYPLSSPTTYTGAGTTVFSLSKNF
jgi:uncharacterized protein (TIGR02001 family)